MPKLATLDNATVVAKSKAFFTAIDKLDVTAATEPLAPTFVFFENARFSDSAVFRKMLKGRIDRHAAPRHPHVERRARIRDRELCDLHRGCDRARPGRGRPTSRRARWLQHARVGPRRRDVADRGVAVGARRHRCRTRPLERDIPYRPWLQPRAEPVARRHAEGSQARPRARPADGPRSQRDLRGLAGLEGDRRRTSPTRASGSRRRKPRARSSSSRRSMPTSTPGTSARIAGTSSR